MAGLDSNTKLLLHMDDVGLTDSSVANTKTMTINGNIARSATQSKFGGYSAYSNGSNAYLSMPHTSDLEVGTGDFTIDFWMWMVSYTNHQMAFRYIEGATDNYGIQLYYLNSNEWRMILRGAGGQEVWTTTASMSTGAWHHVAWIRNSGSNKLYIDGSNVYTNTSSRNINNATNYLHCCGADGYTSSSYYDEMRFSNVARWTTNFTPPTAAYGPDYEVAGTLSDDCRVIIMKESDWSVEDNSLRSAGSYQVDVEDNAARLVVARRTSDSKVLGYGEVTPSEKT